MGAAGEADGGASWWREAGARPSTSFFLATLPEGRRPVRGVQEVDVLQHRGPGGSGEDEAQRRAGRATEARCVSSHGRERRSFGLTSLEVGGWRCLRGVGGAWRQDAERWLNRGGAVRSRGVLAEPVALLHPEVAQRRRSQRQGSESTQHQKVH